MFSLPSIFFILCSKVATRLFVMPNTLKNSTKNGFASASSFEVSAHSFENFNARSFISFQLRTILISGKVDITASCCRFIAELFQEKYREKTVKAKITVQSETPENVNK